MTSGHLLDSSRGQKECSVISLVPGEEATEMEVSGTREQALISVQGQDTPTDTREMLPSDIPGLLLQLNPFVLF